MRKQSPKQDCVIAVLRRCLVLPLDKMMEVCRCSRMTVMNALNKVGYYTSYNFNAGFYTLGDIPDFSEQGLWTYRDKRFSIYRSVTRTVAEVVDHSPAGCSASELEALLGVECRHLLSQLAGKDRLHREEEGRHYLYFSLAPDQQARQKEARFGREVVLPAEVPALLPAGMDARSVIRTLVVAIMEPEATPRQLAARLRREGTFLGAPEVRQVFSFYELEEKRGS